MLEVAPLAAANVRRHRTAYLLLAALVGAGVLSFFAHASFVQTTGEQFKEWVRPLRLPWPVMAWGQRPLPHDLAEDFLQDRQMQRAWLGTILWVNTSRGQACLWAWEGEPWETIAKTLVRGRVPAPGAPEVLVDAGWADRMGIKPGDEMIISYLVPGTRLRRFAVTVVGAVQLDTDFPAHIFAISAPFLPGRNAACAYPREGLHPRALAEHLERRYGLVAWHAETPYYLADTLIRAVSYPGADALRLLYLFVGAGAFTLALLSFLDRRREVAILKAVGVDNRSTALLFLWEIGLAGLVGLLAGGVTAHGLARAGLLWSVPPWWEQLYGAAVTLLVLTLAVALPVGFASQATVNELLQERRIPLFRQRVVPHRR